MRDKAVTDLSTWEQRARAERSQLPSREGIFLQQIPRVLDCVLEEGSDPAGRGSRPHWCQMRNCLPPVGPYNAHSSNHWPMEPTNPILQEKNWKANPSPAVPSLTSSPGARCHFGGHQPSGTTRDPRTAEHLHRGKIWKLFWGNDYHMDVYSRKINGYVCKI